MTSALGANTRGRPNTIHPRIQPVTQKTTVAVTSRFRRVAASPAKEVPLRLVGNRHHVSRCRSDAMRAAGAQGAP